MHWHSDTVFAFDDVGEEVGPVGFGGNAAVDLFHVQREDFGLAGFHRLGDHESDELVERGELLAGRMVSKIFSVKEEFIHLMLTNAKVLKALKTRATHSVKLAASRHLKGFAKCQIADQVESSPDIPFKHVDRIRDSGRFDSFAQFVDEKRCEMLQDISLI